MTSWKMIFSRVSVSPVTRYGKSLPCYSQMFVAAMSRLVVIVHMVSRLFTDYPHKIAFHGDNSNIGTCLDPSSMRRVWFWDLSLREPLHSADKHLSCAHPVDFPKSYPMSSLLLFWHASIYTTLPTASIVSQISPILAQITFSVVNNLVASNLRLDPRCEATASTD